MKATRGNLGEKFDSIQTYWDPHVIAELNGQSVKIAKFKGVFPKHHHTNEDELFLVLKGHISIETEDGLLEASEGEYILIPQGVEHQPRAEREAWVLMFEPNETINTGNIVNQYTKKNLKKI